MTTSQPQGLQNAGSIRDLRQEISKSLSESPRMGKFIEGIIDDIDATSKTELDDTDILLIVQDAVKAALNQAGFR